MSKDTYIIIEDKTMEPVCYHVRLPTGKYLKENGRLKCFNFSIEAIMWLPDNVETEFQIWEFTNEQSVQ